MDFYQSLGFLILGSRMRRLSDYMLSEINKVYQEEGLEFEARWFPLFYVLDQEEEVSIRDLSTRMQISHSAVSQLVSHLKKRGLMSSHTASDDGRKQLIKLTREGERLLIKIKPIWSSMIRAIEEITFEDRDMAVLLKGLTAAEEGFTRTGLSQRMQEILNVQNTCSPTSYAKKQVMIDEQELTE